MARSARHYLSAREAAAALGVRPATLYAYVSRGLVRSEATGGKARRYHAADIAALKRKSEARHPAAAVKQALSFGAPVLDSAITLILDGKLYYRGKDAVRLAREATLSDVAALLWQAEAAAMFAGDNLPALGADFRTAARAVAGLLPIERCLALLPVAAAADPRALDLTPLSLARTSARLLRLLTAIVAGRDPAPEPADAALAEAWDVAAPPGRALLRAALILCADHELNVSAFTARCAASARASPYNAVIAGLAALQGTRHGGESEAADAFLGEALAIADPAALIAQRLKRGERIPGFGHPLYPAGDPRARLLLDMIEEQKRPLVGEARDIAAAAARIIDVPPNVDFALGVLRRSLRLPEGAALGLFAVGRSIGWLAHSMEQYAEGHIIRPRARYVGPAPS
jgi:citrate synthase